jgi:hypothetical protein
MSTIRQSKIDDVNTHARRTSDFAHTSVLVEVGHSLLETWLERESTRELKLEG